MTGDVVFDLRGETAGYNGRPVLHSIDLTVQQVECVALMERSGAGRVDAAGAAA